MAFHNFKRYRTSKGDYKKITVRVNFINPFNVCVITQYIVNYVLHFTLMLRKI